MRLLILVYFVLTSSVFGALYRVDSATGKGFEHTSLRHGDVDQDDGVDVPAPERKLFILGLLGKVFSPIISGITNAFSPPRPPPPPPAPTPPPAPEQTKKDDDDEDEDDD
ncbi:signal peptide-containing protein [Theileria equi strain WA]|uniref:Signal peptide-containing protein n=1 Tax=Theileria equi strain WA TaxID=1537102 RepID=L0AZC6_THEEQ|nr:signal peptide-containing protein [Theileria equi strain WA]AFZ80259.1 signal peptide-containing protein [Theileria equi strain WA]|eukprot:XP_004829925.1 signal peptide-containing protein [Theileria equi strain WA]